MNELQIEKIGDAYDWAPFASITEIDFRMQRLRILVEAPSDMEDFVEIYFPIVEAYHVQANGDFVNYWSSSKFSGNHLIYQITKNGWLDSNDPNSLTISKMTKEKYSEWFIIGVEQCISVISLEPPKIREF